MDDGTGREYLAVDRDLLTVEHDLMTVEQAASYLQLSQSSIRSYIRGGKLKAFRIAGKRKVLIQRADLMALLEPARPTELSH